MLNVKHVKKSNQANRNKKFKNTNQHQQLNNNKILKLIKCNLKIQILNKTNYIENRFNIKLIYYNNKI